MFLYCLPLTRDSISINMPCLIMVDCTNKFCCLLLFYFFYNIITFDLFFKKHNTTFCVTSSVYGQKKLCLFWREKIHIHTWYIIMYLHTYIHIYLFADVSTLGWSHFYGVGTSCRCFPPKLETSLFMTKEQIQIIMYLIFYMNLSKFQMCKILQETYNIWNVCLQKLSNLKQEIFN